MFKFIKALIKLITNLFSTTAARRDHVLKKLVSNDLKDNIINIFDELKNASTLKDGFKQPRNKDFIDSNSESIIDFNVHP